MSEEKACCLPRRRSDQASPTGTVEPAIAVIAHDDIAVPGGTFEMGDHFAEGYAADGERPVHNVELSPFRIDVTTVTVAQFQSFVESTGYVTDAERFGSSAVFHRYVRCEPGDVLGASPLVPWWLEVAGADWRHPYGRHSDIEDLSDHPAVHVSWFDAQAYCTWAGRRLPTEAQWEYAARGGLSGARFPWGDQLRPGNAWQCNIWQGEFPIRNTNQDGWSTTAPVRTYARNGFGLYQMSGNVWEWCADWFAVDTYQRPAPPNPSGPTDGDRRVLRGGSYLCHDSYCHRYRVSARSANTSESTSGNCGFRTAL